ncbi:MAG: hypothetical protein LBJ10_06645 [Clostridiales bacterium]|jgi:hypothetical protein|nr:hypothetical protein [Clostridiales bacterium]
MPAHTNMPAHTVRDRFHRTLAADSSVDRCPAIEWATWWDRTINGWEAEGLPVGLGQQELFGHFGLDPHAQFWFRHEAPDGPKPASHGAPIAVGCAGYDAVRGQLYPADAVRRELPRIESVRAAHGRGDILAWYTLEGFFWYPRKLLGIENHLYSFYDEPELYHRICGDLLEWQLGVVGEFAQYIRADFMTIAEDMSYNNGPMVSEECFYEFIAPYYRRLIPEIKKHGTKVFVDSDGDVSKLVPWLADVGVEGILPLERQAGVDIGALQRAHPGFFWLGGFDKMSLLAGKEAIDAEFERILPMLRRGRFIPSVDHQTPPGVAIENYRYYAMRLRECAAAACKA